jgi:hypothetical protein
MSFDLIDRKFGRRCEPVSTDASAQPRPECWWCNGCFEMVPSRDVTVADEEMHIPCGGLAVPYCDACESGGWVQVYSPCPPSFDVCSACYNPFDYPCP